jgi:PhoPQ-activated pathogenicity-related protein
MQAVPGVRAERFLVTGGSKRGMGSWVAVGADDRIVAAYPEAWNMANFEAALHLRAERLGPDYGKQDGAPGSESPRQSLERLATPRGKEYQRYLDPYLWRDRFANKPVLFTVGANDPLFPPLSDTVFLPEMPKSTRILLVPNFGHGHDTERQFIAWRMWMAHALGDRPVPEVGLTVERREGAIKLAATVTSATTIKAVTAWSATDDRGAYLKSKWNPTPMVGNKGRYQAAVPAPAGSHTAFFVEVEDEDPQAGPGVISTGMQEVKP